MKRPQGLSKASRAKKLKIDSEKETEPSQVAVEFDHEVDPDDEIGQLIALFESYRKSAGDNPKILHGIVHECDRILRNVFKDSDETSSSTPSNSAISTLPSEFHNIYAESLLELGRYASEGPSSELKDSSKAFAEAAIERASLGLADYPSNPDLLLTRAKGRIALVDETMKSTNPSERYGLLNTMVLELDQAVKDYEHAETPIISDGSTANENDKENEPDILENQNGNGTNSSALPISSSKSKSLYTSNQLDIVQSLLQIAEAIGAVQEQYLEDENTDEQINLSLGDVRMKYLEWSKTRWEQILIFTPKGKGKSNDSDDSFNIIGKANRGLGEYYLAKSSYSLAELEDENEVDEEDDEEGEDDNNESEEFIQARNTAKQQVEKAIEYLLKAENDQDGELLVNIAEAQISLANLQFEGSDEQTLLYHEAIGRLRRAQRLGVGNFQALIDELSG